MATSNVLSKEPQAQDIFTKLHYVHTYAPLYKFKVFPYKRLLITALIQKSGESYYASTSVVLVPGKQFLKQKNNELNELSECMLYKMFAFPENISKL